MLPDAPQKLHCFGHANESSFGGEHLKVVLSGCTRAALDQGHTYVSKYELNMGNASQNTTKYDDFVQNTSLQAPNIPTLEPKVLTS